MVAFQSQPLELRTLAYGFAAGDQVRLRAARAFLTADLSDRRIAAELNIDRDTVGRWRREWRETIRLAASAERELGHAFHP